MVDLHSIYLQIVPPPTFCCHFGVSLQNPAQLVMISEWSLLQIIKLVEDMFYNILVVQTKNHQNKWNITICVCLPIV